LTIHYRNHSAVSISAGKENCIISSEPEPCATKILPERKLPVDEFVDQRPSREKDLASHFVDVDYILSREQLIERVFSVIDRDVGGIAKRK
jgi:hypothetical protein